ncbi:hypothetical protein Tco_0624810 [Tanacetum coccineum]|uniref:Uncharacterized protein n=1 Tax=Tanacetum coccineum TaxID=301880 RepID=A0ABQ4WF25_9ASTR
MVCGRCGVSNVLDMAYRGFPGVGTAFDIFRNILFPYGFEYGVLGFPGYGVLDLVSFMVFDGFHPERYSPLAQQRYSRYSQNRNSWIQGRNFDIGMSQHDDVALNTSVQDSVAFITNGVCLKITRVVAPSGLVLYQMTSDHNRSELGIHDHSNEPSSSKLVPKVVPLAVKTATSRQKLELLFHLHISMLMTTGINPMIQPEPEDLPKDNPKLEIAVLRWQSAPASEY